MTVWTRGRAGVAVAAALAAGLAAATVGRSGWRSSGAADEVDEFASFVEAADGARLVEPRLTGGFAYAPLTVPRGDAATRLSPAIRIAAARLEQAAGQSAQPSLTARHAAALIATGEPDRGVAILTGLRRDRTPDPRVLSDIAAGYLVVAHQDSLARGPNAVRALDAATTAVRLSPTLAEAWFNRAVAAEAILPPGAAADAWNDYLAVDGSSPWAGEARERQARARNAAGSTDAAGSIEAAARGVTSGDAAADLVRARPQDVREWMLDSLLPEWADAALRGDSDKGDLLRTGRLLSAALATTTGDGLLRDAIDFVESANQRTDEARVLARGLAAYGAGRRLYRAERLDDALSAFRRSVDELTPNHPVGLWAQLQTALLAFDFRRLHEAEKVAADVSRRAGSRQYHALQARAEWILGLARHQLNRIDEALGAYSVAADLFRRIGETENELGVRTSLSDNLRLRGERQRSWQHVTDVLTRSTAIRSPVRRYVAFYNASLFALDENLLEAARQFQDLAVQAAGLAPTPGPVAEGLASRARIQHRLGRAAAAADDLRDAAAALDRAAHTDGYLAAWIDAVRGETLLDADPARAILHLREAADYFKRSEPALYGRLLLWQARAELRSGDAAAAARTLDEGILDFEERRLRIRDEALRISYLDDSWDLFTEMVDLQLRHRRAPDAAFVYAERGRARSLLDRTAAESGGMAIGRNLRLANAGEIILAYKQMPDRLLCWVVSGDRREIVEIPVTHDALTRQVRDLRDAITAQHARDRFERAASALHRLLLAPLESRLAAAGSLVIVPDGALHDLPFAALVDPASGRFLVETHRLTVTPSVSLYATSRPTRERPRADVSLLAVGDPRPDPRMYGGLPPLPGSEAEAEAIARLYRRSRVLTRAAATKAAFASAAGDADVVHFSGHAVANIEYPWLSALLLSADGADDSGGLFAHEIAAMPFRRTRLVALAACDTAVGVLRRGEGPLSLARPFLMAGVPHVLATQWKIDDRGSRELMERFHRGFARGAAAADALRAAQIELLRSGDARLGHPYTWAGVLVIGMHAAEI